MPDSAHIWLRNALGLADDAFEHLGGGARGHEVPLRRSIAGKDFP